MKTVSVILASYNGGKYIRNQLDSILAQTYPVYEILIGDDGSTDDTIPILNEYAGKYSHIIIIQPDRDNHGVNYNFKRLMDLASGDYLALSDQDDIWFPEKIEVMIKGIGSHLLAYSDGTTSLTEPEIQRVFAMMRTLKEQGVGIIFISHKLGEVMEICDRYTVLRDGCMVAQGLVKDTNSKKLAEYMVGHEIRTESLKRDQNYGDEMLRLENLSDGKHFRDISLSVRAGQVLGITGLLGDGRSELFQTVFGAMGGHYTGKVVIGGKEVHLTDTHQALLEGLAYLPRNRKENAILKDMSILDNGTIVQLPKFVRGLFINKNQQQEAFRIQQEKLRIKMGDKYDLITSLSGGNQQKVVLAKWVMSDPKVLILDNPSQGVDVGAKEEIYGIIHRLAQEGVAIVVLSSEAQEIIRVCDSSLVMYHGRIVGHVSGEDMNEKHIMYLATGGNQSEKEGAM